MNTNELDGRARVAFATLGCKVNQAESDQLARGFVDAGFVVVPFEQPADAYVINSCTVTHIADRKSRQLIRQARRANQNGLIVATGCYAAVSSEEVAKTTPIDLVVANQDKARLVEIVLEELALEHPRSLIGHLELAHRSDRTRAFVKIQDGCNSLCSFCIIPYARGREQSVSLPEVLDTVRERVAGGHHEIVLTGVHIGTYGRDLAPPVTLRDLLRAVLDETDARRVRLSSIEPWSFDPSILDCWQSSRLCRHFHLALQSGSDAVLRRMRRPYDTVQFVSVLDSIRRQIPDAAVTTDVIVGFPGESEGEFEQSLHHVSGMAFAAVHVFPYSPRSRTAAAKLSDQLSPSAKRDRAAAMLAIAADAGRQYRNRFVGRTLDVLFERALAVDDGESSDPAHALRWEGLTDNYIRVLASSNRDLTNRLLPVRLKAADHGGAMTGDVIGDEGEIERLAELTGLG